MRTSLHTIISTDNLELPAMLFEPESHSKKAAIFLHGNGDSGVFYKLDMMNSFAEELTQRDISFVGLNNRGARYKKNLIVHGSGAPGEEAKVKGGAHYELIADCVHDIDGTINFLESLGYREFYLLGFSTGANKICVYDDLVKNNRVSKYVHAGPGDDSGLFFNEIGEKHFRLSLALAKQYIDSVMPEKIMPKYSKMYPFSAQSAFDILDPDGAYNTFPYFEQTQKRLGTKVLFKEYKAIKKPQLIVFGENDEFTYTGGGTQQTLKLLESVTSKESLKNSSFQIVPNTDHGFHGKEQELAMLVSEWLINS